MATSSVTEYRAHGAIILERLRGITVPAGLKAHVATFKSGHDDYEAAAVVADVARGQRDLALEAVGEADDTFDTGVNVLADKLVGAGLGARKNPFASYSKHTPSELTELPYAEEPKAICALAEALSKTKPPADVAKALAQSLKDAKAIEVALGRLVKPQAAYSSALGNRDALLPAWTKARDRLKKHAAAAWDENVATYKAIFAAPGALQAPKNEASEEDDQAPGGPADLSPRKPRNRGATVKSSSYAGPTDWYTVPQWRRELGSCSPH